ncbi:LOW QUALITY PROTEIN: hepatitis A virus cellular receptor 1 [Labeo rohita]|uniref:LOW QUALITY PROTEIN: hepatitis A virus cellular receptor 1 n=1 Tax=Labeo rohita TaxID=84645 RepID=UPI0021E21277|nr:LOW QUALITY PROTEIN: hepatitis A virus cellular receptor 1 [Labeo rohita]
MTDLHSWLFASWILCYLTVSQCRDVIVQSFEGESVILPCKYDSKYHGKCHICWMRGDIPNMGCGNEIIGSDGDKVVRQKSSRYQLMGEIQHGDVSLTIQNIKKTDSGKYGCRIHVPGLFNDEMYYVHLIVNNALIPTLETTSMSSSTSEHETTGVFSTAMTEAPGPTTPEPLLTTISGHITSETQTTETSGVETNTTQESSTSVSSTNAPETSTAELWSSGTTHEDIPFDYRESSSVENKESVNASAVIVPVLLLLLSLIVIAVILILKQKKKTRAAGDITQNSDNSVIYSNSGSSVGLYNREMAVENVYQIQPENEYEQWH